MGLLGQLEPVSVFRFFEEICAVPHGSGNMGPISSYCEAFAAKRGLTCHRDGADNVIIIKPATPGYEKAEPLILQGHLDMVCVKEPGCKIDFERDGLELAADGDWIYARGTSLGGDDGIAVAMMLAALDSRELRHPRLEAVFTTDEEIGMLGAAALDVSPLLGRRLLNLDSEEEGVFIAGCAGGVVAKCALPAPRAPAEGIAVTLSIDGLSGGHSGTEIDKGRGNAIRLMGRLLDELRRALPLRLAALEGGVKDNAIPIKAEAILVIDPGDADKAAAVTASFGEVLRREYRVADSGLRVTLTPGAPLPEHALTPEATSKVITLLTALPNGVQEMSRDIPGLVQTSLNLGIVKLEEDSLTATLCIRSSLNSQKNMLKRQVEAIVDLLGGKHCFSGDYPPWEYRQDSPLREQLTELFPEQYGKDPTVTAMHGGLECGLLLHKLPGLDCVSLGPELKDIHTARERMSISSVQRVWRLLTAFMEKAR